MGESKFLKIMGLLGSLLLGIYLGKILIIDLNITSMFFYYSIFLLGLLMCCVVGVASRTKK